MVNISRYISGRRLAAHVGNNKGSSAGQARRRVRADRCETSSSGCDGLQELGARARQCKRSIPASESSRRLDRDDRRTKKVRNAAKDTATSSDTVTISAGAQAPGGIGLCEVKVETCISMEQRGSVLGVPVPYVMGNLEDAMGYGHRMWARSDMLLME